MSRSVRAPSAAIDWRSAPTRFCEPSLTVAGPNRIFSSEPTVPTLIRVPRGRTGDGAAMPQFTPRPGASAARATVGDDGHVAAGLSLERISRRGDVRDGGHLGHADAQHLAGRAGGARADAHEHRGRALL